jgi:hypothetical protein
MKTSNIVGQVVVHLPIRYTQHVVFRIFNAPAPIKTTVCLNIFFPFSYKSLSDTSNYIANLDIYANQFCRVIPTCWALYACRGLSKP